MVKIFLPAPSAAAISATLALFGAFASVPSAEELTPQAGGRPGERTVGRRVLATLSLGLGEPETVGHSGGELEPGMRDDAPGHCRLLQSAEVLW
jgi:hypothetical protein